MVSSRTLALALFASGLLASTPGVGATPADILVVASQIDDLSTLDPAEIFEYSGAEYAANAYDRLIGYDGADWTRPVPRLARSWTVDATGRAWRFELRNDAAFHAGGRVEAEDVVYSLRRALALAKAPVGLLRQIGLRQDGIRALDGLMVEIETDRAYAPGIVLGVLASSVASIVDRREVEARATNGDWGHGWLRRAAAGSGPFRLLAWRANERLSLERHDGHWDGAPAMRRVVLRHMPEPASQRLLIEQGDVDIARNLGPDQAKGALRNPDLRAQPTRKASIWFLALNTRHPDLGQAEIRAALREAVDYQGIARGILAGRAVVHQSVLPGGLFGALSDVPFGYAPERLAQALAGRSLRIAMDVRAQAPVLDVAQALQANFAKAGLVIELRPADAKQVLTRFRERRYDMVLARWASDTLDPQSDAEAFSRNRDNSDGATLRNLAWRAAWVSPEIETLVDRAALERDEARRADLLVEVQRRHREDGPFVVLFQEIEPYVLRRDIRGFAPGPTPDTVLYARLRKERR
jgi:peptide/nickel transport system substrate-binding protein